MLDSDIASMAQLDADENPLEAVLLGTQAFVLPPATQPSKSSDESNVPAEPPPQVTDITAASTSPETSQSAPPNVEGTSNQDAWKAEYEAQVESWREQSAGTREKAEKERQHWEQVREAEKRAGVDKGPIQTGIPSHPPVSEAGWDTLSDRASASVRQETIIQSRVSNASPVRPQAKAPLSQAETNDESSRWEDLQSSSSIPSILFPEETPQPPPRRADPAPTPLPRPTLTIFDSTLPTQTRIHALLSSLAINLLLPFVNGVMLGFGEIFAKNVVMGWLGWNTPVASSVGLKQRSSWWRNTK